jgi:DNA-binding LytR/AlgR family response regulator
MRCIIVEDQPPAQRILKKYISDIGTLQLMGTFSDSIRAMEYLKATAIDLIFLDIHLPKLSGLDLIKILPKPPAVILTTAFSDYALESYELDVVDYLLKPFSFQRFVKAVAKVPAPAAKKEMFIKSGYEYVKIVLDDILYIKSDADYTEVLTPDKKYLSAEPLRYWEACLDPLQFFRVHKSYIVHTSKIEKVAANQLYLGGDVVVPIGRAYKEDFVGRYLK